MYPQIVSACQSIRHASGHIWGENSHNLTNIKTCRIKGNKSVSQLTNRVSFSEFAERQKPPEHSVVCIYTSINVLCKWTPDGFLQTSSALKANDEFWCALLFRTWSRKMEFIRVQSTRTIERPVGKFAISWFEHDDKASHRNDHHCCSFEFVVGYWCDSTKCSDKPCRRQRFLHVLNWSTGWRSWRQTEDYVDQILLIQRCKLQRIPALLL